MMGNNEYKKRHKDLGLCVDCSDKAVYGTRCAKHTYNLMLSFRKHYYNNRKKFLDYAKKQRKQRIEAGQCPVCGTPNDNGKYKCDACLEGLHPLKGTKNMRDWYENNND